MLDETLKIVGIIAVGLPVVVGVLVALLKWAWGRLVETTERRVDERFADLVASTERNRQALMELRNELDTIEKEAMQGRGKIHARLDEVLTRIPTREELAAHLGGVNQRLKGVEDQSARILAILTDRQGS